MAVMELWRRRDLEGAVKTEYVDGNFFTQDSAGNLVGVRVYSGGAEAALTGSVTGYCVLPSGETVEVAGSRSGNEASILVPQSALAYTGPLGITLKLVDGNTITTLMSIIVVVYRSKTDTVITPSSQIITDWANQISAALQEVEDASAAQDAKIDDLKSALVNDNNFDCIADGVTFTDTTHNGVTFVRNSDGTYSVSGTSTSPAYARIAHASNRLPDDIVPGESYYLRYEADNVSFRVRTYSNGAWSSFFVNRKKSGVITIPSDAVGMEIQLFVNRETTVDEIVSPKLFLAKDDDQKKLERVLINAAESADTLIISGLGKYSAPSGTDSGLTFEAVNNNTAVHVYGTATARVIKPVYSSPKTLPAGLEPGGSMVVSFATTNASLVVSVLFYLEDGTTQSSVPGNFAIPMIIAIPDTAVGLAVRLWINSGVTLDDYISVPMLLNAQLQRFVMPAPITPPRLVSFIDDDTTSDDLVYKYYQACKHNGVVGAYAVITGRYKSEENDIQLLLDYAADGFDMIPHCTEQQRYLDTADTAYDEPRAYKKYVECLTDFRDLGLINPQNMWIVPYGRYDEKTLRMAKRLGFDLAFSTIWSTINTIGENNRYKLRRAGFSPLDAVTDDTDSSEYGTLARIKRQIDELMDRPGGGWMIITTHFNTWGNIAWDSTQDGNGYEIGYSRLNELIQYVKASGANIVSMSEGAAMFKPYLYRNESIT